MEEQRLFEENNQVDDGFADFEDYDYEDDNLQKSSKGAENNNPPIQMPGTRFFTDKAADKNEMAMLPDNPKTGDVVIFEYTNPDGSIMYSTWTYQKTDNGEGSPTVGRWEGGVGKNHISYNQAKYVSLEEVNNLKTLAKAESTKNNLDPDPPKSEAGTEKEEEKTAKTKKPVETKKKSPKKDPVKDPKKEDKDPEPEKKKPPTVTSHAEFKLRDDWFEAGKQRNLAYSTLREVSNFLKENPGQKFAIHIYISTGGKGKADDLVGGDSGWFSSDTNVTSYSGKTLKALAWGRYMTVRDIIRSQSGIKNATLEFVPHYNATEHKFIVKPIN